MKPVLCCVILLVGHFQCVRSDIFGAARTGNFLAILTILMIKLSKRRNSHFFIPGNIEEAEEDIKSGVDVNKKSSLGFTALHYAAANGK